MKRMMTNLIKKNIIPLLFSLSYASFLWGQELPHNLTNVVAKSPEAASIDRYGYYPVDMSVGVPDITIPLYTIKVGEIEYPLSMSYHLGGIRVDDIATWIGLGWTLKSNGAISRTMKGLPDDGSYGILTNTGKVSEYPVSSSQNISVTMPILREDFYLLKDNGSAYTRLNEYLRSIEYNYLDGESDIYSYNINNVSGSFAYGIDKNREFLEMPRTDNKITRIPKKGNEKYDSYKIVGDDGTIYFFNGNDGEVTGTEICNDYISTWMLSSIVSPNRADTITFTYESGGSYTEFSPSYSFWYGSQFQAIPDANGCVSYTEITNQSGANRSGSYTWINEKRLKHIKFRGGSIDFKESPEKRKDKRDYALEEILIKDIKGNLVKRIKFEYDYFTSESINPVEKLNYRLKLERIKIFGKDQNNPQIYHFTYNENNILPPYYNYIKDKGDPQQNFRHNGQDHWGYYNGKINSHLVGIVPDNALFPFQDTKADREPNETYMKSCILEKIDYPTGGYSIFETEAHRDRNGKLYGGLRIVKLISWTDADELTTLYTYEDAYDLFTPDPGFYTYNTILHEDGGHNAPLQYYMSAPVASHGYYMGSPLIYGKVTKSEISKNRQNGKSVYTYPKPPLLIDNYFSGIQSHSGNEFLSSTVQLSQTPISWMIGQPVQEEHYVNGVNYPLKKIINEYQPYNRSWPIKMPGEPERMLMGAPVGFRSSKKVVEYNSPCLIQNDEYKYAKQGREFTFSYLPSGCIKLVKRTEMLYNQQTETYITTETQYRYDNIESKNKPNILLTSEITKDSKSATMTKQYLYPQDYSENSIMRLMTNENMLNYPIEQITFKEISDKSLMEISRKRRNYNSMLFPASDQSSTNGISSLRTDVTYDSYDLRGNLAQYTSINNISTVYLWGYKGLYPIAEIKNAVYSQVIKAIPDATIKSISEKVEPTAADWQAINSLRSNQNLTNAHISTYTYQPLVGILTSTDSKGVITSFDYDAFGRLKEVKNADKQIVSTYQYQYIGKTFPDIELQLPAANEYVMEKDYNIFATVKGGSGNFEYTWTLKTSSGILISSSNNTPNNNFSIKIARAYLGTAMELGCSVRDIVSEKTISITKSFNVIKPPIEFNNIKYTSVYPYTEQKVTAEIVCDERLTVSFSVEVGMDYNAGSVEFNIASSRFNYSANKDEVRNIVLTPGTNYIEIILKKNPSMASYLSASLRIKSITPTYVIGYNSSLSLY